MSTTNPALLGQFPLTAPDIALSSSPGGLAQDADVLMTETLSEAQNYLQDLTNRLIETPGSNLDFLPDVTRGVGIMLYLNATTDKIAGLAGKIDAEFEKDPRTKASFTELSTTVDADGNAATLISTQVESVLGVFGFSWVWGQTGVTPLPITTGS